MFAGQVVAQARPGPLWLLLALAGGPGVEERVRDLAERESGCYSFFASIITPSAKRIVLDMAVDQHHAWVLKVLATRTVTATRP
ncbi:MAG: hypothetical protein LBV60_10370 [Streptomyces sp.]|nr:hypothetical protein [Streptomyces sp.]